MEYAPEQTVRTLGRPARKRCRDDIGSADDKLPFEQNETEKCIKRRRKQEEVPTITPTSISSSHIGELDPMEKLARTSFAPRSNAETTLSSLHAKFREDRVQCSALHYLGGQVGEGSSDVVEAGPDEKVLNSLKLPPLSHSEARKRPLNEFEKASDNKRHPTLYDVQSILEMKDIFWTNPEWAIDWDWLIYDRVMDMPENRLMNQVHLFGKI